MNGTTIPVIVTGGMAILARAAQGVSPTNQRGGTYGKIVLGTFVVGAMLSILTGRAEQVATMFAWVAAITSSLVNGQAVFTAISKVTG